MCGSLCHPATALCVMEEPAVIGDLPSYSETNGSFFSAGIVLLKKKTIFIFPGYQDT